MALNAIVPVLSYKLFKRYVSRSEFSALVVATTFPLGKSIFDVTLRGQVDPVSIVILLGIATDCIALLFGGSARLLLVRESLFSGAFGLACFLSLLLPRPMMFLFGRQFMAGTDPQKRVRFDASWQLPEVRFSNRLITAVWGCVFLGELILRIALIYTVSAATVLFVSPILLGTLTIITLMWTLSYARRIRLRVFDRVTQLLSSNAS